ncbi:uncharacterized protein LOC123507490 [Portunus trituberculatus]|uniref:uncharacterized protein LOC123507490 n=1 Tax=Portunus trituberculatus TaxID=210409 RepID=UPI001E1CB0AE|nr:uncharacterized protein LOC123507490 [Portunus trituberculatus]
MFPRGSQWHLLLPLTLCCLASPASQITGSLFEKMDLPAEVLNNCLLTVVPQIPASQHSSTYFCAIQCLHEPNCTTFCISDNTTQSGGAACELVNATVVPSGSRAQQANGSCFARFRSPWPRGADLARGKAVKVPGAWDDYADKQTVVSGYKCEVSQYDCFCSSFKLISSSYFTVDLGASQPVGAVVVTVSSYFPEYFKNVEIRVGDRGDGDDPCLTSTMKHHTAGRLSCLRGTPHSLAATYRLSGGTTACVSASFMCTAGKDAATLPVACTPKRFWFSLRLFSKATEVVSV